MRKLLLACALAACACAACAEAVIVQDGRGVFGRPSNYGASKISPCALEKPLTFEDGRKVKTAAIQARIDEVAAKGGGRVTISKGIHPCRTLYMKSGVELHLEKGAVLMGGTKPEDYDDAIPENMVYTYKTATQATSTRKVFIFAENATNIAITGEGTIDVNGPAFFDQNTVLWGKFWAKPSVPRPRIVVLRSCRNIRFEGVTFKDNPTWAMWLRFCEDIEVSAIRIEAEQKMINSDGIDFDGCRRVRVRDSFFKTGDDCIVLRAIRGTADVNGPVVTEDVVVENCSFDTPCQGVRIGCPSDDTIRNAVFRNIKFKGKNAIGSEQPTYYLTEGDNGYLTTDDILFENWTISGQCPLELFVDDGIVLRDFGYMTFRNFTVDTDKPFMVRGNAMSPVRGMRFENITGKIKADKAFDIAHAPGIIFDKTNIEGNIGGKTRE